LNEESEQALLTTFRQLTMQEAFKPLEDQALVSNRLIDVRGQLAGVIWFDFLKICDGPRSQNDYIEIAEQFGTVLISGVPQFSVSTEDQARRFISLVDEFYDRKVKLIVSAEASISKLYQGRRVRFEFERTMSRLLEMQSDAYLGLQHRA
jgi:cell division protein ZapE